MVGRANAQRWKHAQSLRGTRVDGYALARWSPFDVHGREHVAGHSLARAAHRGSLQRDGDAGRHVAAGWEVRAARQCGATQGRCEEAILVGLARVDACAPRPRRRRARRAAADTIAPGAACRVVAHADVGRAVARALDERAADGPSVARLWRVQLRGPRARRQSGCRSPVARAARDGKCGDEDDHALLHGAPRSTPRAGASGWSERVGRA